MRKFIALIILFFISTNLSAQTPGYLGKKLTVGYDFHFYMGGIDRDARKYDASYNLYQPSLFINSFHEIHADYVLTKSYSLGLSYQLFNTGQFYEEQEDYYDQNTSNYIYYSTNNYLNITGSAIVVNNKFFFFNSGTGLAPTGNYGQFGIGLITSKSTAKIKGTKNDGSGSTAISKIVTHEKVSTPIISGGLGNQTILFDRVIVDVGLELAFLPGSVKGWLSDGSSSSYLTTTFPVEENAKNAVLTRLQTFYVSSVKIGVGILLF